MEKKVLEIAQPIINYIPPVDMILAIGGTNKMLYENIWIENYIAIEITHKFLNFDDPTIEFSGFKDWRNFRNYMEINNIPRSYIKENFLRLIINAIDNEHYCFYDHNTFYVSAYRNFGVSKERHEIFIFGYDKKMKVFYTKDYFDYIHYDTKLVTFDEIVQAYYTYDELNEDDYLDGILLIKPKTNCKLDIDFDKIRTAMISLVQNSYLCSSLRNYKIGFSFFEELILLISFVDIWDKKLFSFLFNHLFLMKYRLKKILPESEYMAFDGMLSDLLNLSKSVNLMALKSSIIFDRKKVKPKSNIRNKMINCLKEIKNKYTKVIFEYLENTN